MGGRSLRHLALVGALLCAAQVCAGRLAVARPMRLDKQQPQPSANHPKRRNAARYLLAGAIAGAVSNTVVAPIDILRLNLIVSNDKAQPLKFARLIYQRGGIAGFWHGNTADVIRTIPASAIRFYCFAMYKTGLQEMGLAIPAAVSLIAGGFAGMSAMAACFPLETVRTRMATIGAANGLSLFGYTSKLVKAEGISALYRGLTPSLISVMPYFAVRFGSYDILLRWRNSLGRGNCTGTDTAVIGAVAGLAASTLTFPFELVRRRAMIGSLGMTNPFTAMVNIARAEGFCQGLYKGFGLSLVKVAPSSAVTFFTYEVAYTMLGTLAFFASEDEAKANQARLEQKKAAAEEAAERAASQSALDSAAD